MEIHPETHREAGVGEDARLAGRIALAGGSVARASEELRHVADALQAAAAQAREADARVRELEQRVEELTSRLVALGDTSATKSVSEHERAALQEAIATEIRRPLTSILGITLALKHHDPDSTDGRDMVKQLTVNARKLDRLVMEFLQLDQLLHGTLSPNRRRSDVGALVRRLVDESPDLANRQVVVEAERVSVSVDPALTEQIVESLLANAGRRTAPGNRVLVTVTAHPDGAVVAVDDPGPAVTPEVRDAMVTAALSTGPQRAARPRAAAGMSLLARLAAVQGGKAWVEDRPDGGASFRVFLPDVLDATDAAASLGGGTAVPAGVDRYRALEGPVAIEGGIAI